MSKTNLEAIRNKGILCVGCASTASAATYYETFDTVHSLFESPVIEVEEREISDDNSND